MSERFQRARNRFRNVPASYTQQLPLIGVVGEIFCCLNNFSNADLVRKLELEVGEGWLTDIAEGSPIATPRSLASCAWLGRRSHWTC